MSVHAIMIESADLSSEEILFQCKLIKCLKPDKIIELFNNMKYFFLNSKKEGLK